MNHLNYKIQKAAVVSFAEEEELEMPEIFEGSGTVIIKLSWGWRVLALLRQYISYSILLSTAGAISDLQRTELNNQSCNA